MKQTILKVFKKEVETEKGITFDTFYGYDCELDNTGETPVYVERKYPLVNKEGATVMSRKSIHVRFTQECMEKLKQEEIPCVLLLNEDDFFITIDKYKNKKPRLDKNGKKHLILVVKSFQEQQFVEPTKFTFDDVVDF